MKLISPLLAASLLLSLTPVVRAMEPEDWDQEPVTTTQKITNFMGGLSRTAQIKATARYIADLQDPGQTIKSEDIEIAAAAIDFLTTSNPRTLTETEKAQLATMAQNVYTYLDANDDIAQSLNGQYLAAANATLTSFIAQDPKADDASGDEEEKEDAAQQQELDLVTLSHRITAGQKYVEAGIEKVAMGLAGFVEANPKIAKLPQRLATSQGKLLKHEFEGKGFSLDALRKKQLLAAAEMFKKHAEKPEEVNQLAIFLDCFQLNIDLSLEVLNKLAPPAKASAKTAARLWANADWASMLPGLQQAGESFLTCLSTVLSNYEAEVAKVEGDQNGDQRGDESEDEDDNAAQANFEAKVQATQVSINAAQAELDRMLAELHASSSSSSSSSASVELP